MFINWSERITHNPPQLHYGIAITDTDGDGIFEAVVCGYGCSNLVLKWVNGGLLNVAPAALADPHRQAIGVAAADIDADGLEEIYFLNTDTYAGQKRFADRLFDRADSEWVDLFSLPIHRNVVNLTSGRSVAAIDRFGRGVYGFLAANYGGPLRLYELSEDGVLADVAGAAAVDFPANGRSLLALPLLTGRQDIFVGNEHGPNFLFFNNGDGTYAEVAEEMAVHDPTQSARGAAALDANNDGQFDILCANWEGPHRLFLQSLRGPFEDCAPAALRQGARARTVVAADFDNDGRVEVFFNNMDEPNRLFGYREKTWVPLEIGDALEPNGLGTGAAVADFDGDGQLELLIAHGESAPQPLSLYKAPPREGFHWLRVLPLTPFGAPARGATVTVETPVWRQIRAIDAGSGYLCQMEPVAHFGLGPVREIERVTVRWLDGMTKVFENVVPDQLLRVPHPGQI
jgi:hypothetical protein